MADPKPIEARGYVHPEVLVSTDWVEKHIGDAKIKVFESDEDVLLYDTGHVPGAQKLDWVEDLNDKLTRDYLTQEGLPALLRRKGVNEGDTIVLYGDKNNWWATYAFWVLRLFGVEGMKIMDGGRARWVDEKRKLAEDVPTPPAGNLKVGPRDDSRIRAFRDDVMAHVEGKLGLIDVRSPEEFSGERLHMPDYPNEGALRGGHIPGARNVPWARAVDPDTHLFRTAQELRKLYQEDLGLAPGQPVITYCRIGERSSHTWFVLTYLLGFKECENYDGSWTEWGNLVRAPIER
jgi:thiosulfate/3-mercaptopyruvate sulfurtransferase